MSDSDKEIVHAQGHGQGEHSLCGMAFDAYESGDSEAPIVFAKPGQVVTCPDCQSHIHYVRSSFRNFRYQPKETTHARH